MTRPAVAETYFKAWKTRNPALLKGLFSPDVAVTGPLGHIDGAERYEHALAQIFKITNDITIVKRWTEDGDVLTWFDLHHTRGEATVPVANWLHVENGLITRVRIAFDARQILTASGGL